jgi:glycosyltransferase involved in cell wall biosynthesis
VFAGDGPYRAKLQADCPQAIFTGMCSHAELAVMYASSDLFLFPSLTETFGNVTLEALASGTPVLAFDCAAATEVIEDQTNGWLVSGEDGQDYVRKALALTANPNDLIQAKTQAHASILPWDWQEIVSQVEAIFRNAMTVGSKV